MIFNELLENKKLYYQVVGCVSLSSFLTLLAIHSINVSLATIAKDLAISEVQVGLIPQAYLISLCSFMLLVGKLADRFNPKWMFIGGVLLFMVTSVLLGFAESFEALVVWRAFQGVGGAVIQAVGTLILVRTVPVAYRGKAFGVNGMFASLGLLLGAPIGGLLTSMLNWHWVFFLSVPACILCLIMVICLPDMTKDRSHAKKVFRIDWMGVVLSTLALSSLMYGFNRAAEDGFRLPLVWLLLLVGILSTLWLLYHLKRCDYAIVDMKLFANRRYIASLIVIVVANLLLTGNNFVLPFYMQYYQSFDSQEVGFMFLFFSIAYLIVSPIAGQLTDRLGSQQTLLWGVVICVVAYVVFLFLMAYNSIWSIGLFLIFLGGGLSLLMISSNVYSFENVPSEQVGEATALYRLMGLIGAVIGINLFSSLLSGNRLLGEGELVSYQCVYVLSLLLSLSLLFGIRRVRAK